MALSRPQNRLTSALRKVLRCLVASAILCFGAVVCTEAQDSHTNNTQDSWTVTTQYSGNNMTPCRTTETHTTSGNRRIDTLHKEVLGLSGDYQPYSDTETEAIDVNPTTKRTVVRTYTWDGNGRRNLAEVTEEEARSSAGGDIHVVRTTSTVDESGNMQVVRREVTGTTNPTPQTQQVQTTTYVGDGNGGFTPYLQIRELQKRISDHTIEITKTTLHPDPDGKWAVGEVRQGTIEEGSTMTVGDERVSRSNVNGRLSEVSRTVAKQTVDASGEQRDTVETYSLSDTDPHLSRRVTTIQQNKPSEKTSTELIEESDPGDPDSPLRAIAKTTDIFHSDPTGMEQTRVSQVRDVNGTFKIVVVQTRKSDQATPPQDH